MIGIRMHRREWSSVEAPARLHLGFLDLNGSLGRRFGSLGLTLEGLSTRVYAARAETLTARGMQKERVLLCLRQLKEEFGFEGGVELVVEHGIPQHMGLGSGTQLALAVGAAVSDVFGLGLEPRPIAHLLDRGGRSGIGVGAFEQGGFLVDGGRGQHDAPPPLVSRMEFPGHWRVILIFDHTVGGLHGSAEREAFHKLPVFPDAAASRLCRLLLMQALPALAEADIAEFGAAVSEIQCVVGDHFAPVQGGRYTSTGVARALSFLESQGVSCLGQSSWGPTGFAIVDSESHARALVHSMRESMSTAPALDFGVYRGRNRGADTWRGERAPTDAADHGVEDLRIYANS